MARPKDNPKTLDPAAPEDVSATVKPAGGGGGNGLLNMILLAVIIVLATTVSSAASMYFLAPLVLKPMLAASAPAAEGEEGAEGEEAAAEGEGGEGEGEGEEAAEPPLPKVGPVIDLEEFTVNLKDKDAERYLRADLSVMVSTEDPKFGKLEGEEAHKWEEGFHHEMAHYVPSIRDSVIAALTRRTSAELRSEMGKQKVKDEITRDVDALFHGEHRVIRVNLENFIIQ